MEKDKEQVIVIGGGLAGLIAALELVENGIPVTLLEMMDGLGGNSSKGTCGIAAPGVNDGDTFEDLKELAKGDPDAMDMLNNAAEDLTWILEELEIKHDVSCDFHTPGHARPRTCGSKGEMPGKVVTMAAVYFLQELSQKMRKQIRIVTHAKVDEIIQDDDTNKVLGVRANVNGHYIEFKGTVLLASGGFGGRTDHGSLLARNNDAHCNEPTLSNYRAVGLMHEHAIDIGAETTHMGQVNYFPMAFKAHVDGGEVRICVSEVLFCGGVGGQILDAKGKRVLGGLPKKEMERADIRVDTMVKDKNTPYRLVFPEAFSSMGGCDFYCRFYEQHKVFSEMSADELRAAMGGCKLDDALGPGPFWVAEIYPAIYTTVGGLSVDEKGAVKGGDSLSGGLWAAGEIVGKNFPELYGCSGVPLLHCITSGRKAARNIAIEMKGSTDGRKTLKNILMRAMMGGDAEPEDEVADEDLVDLTKEELIEKIKELRKGGASGGAAAGPKAITVEDVAKHNTKEDAWLIVNGEAMDVTAWIPLHPGGEPAIIGYLGQDASNEWNAIHKVGTIEAKAKTEGGPKLLGKIGTAAAAASGGGGGGGDGGLTMEEVAKHKTKEDAWTVINGEAVDVTAWIPIHPGGEPAIMGVLGEDCTNEWCAIHKPGTVEAKAALPNGPKILGKVSGAPAGGGGGGGNADCPLCGYVAPEDPEKPDPHRTYCTSPIGAIYYLIKAIALMLVKTIFFTHNFVFVITGERNGTIRSAIFLLVFTIVHAGGNAFDVFIGGPREVNGETYFFDRQHLASIDAGVVEVYLGMAIVLHVVVALKRTWDISMDYSLLSGRWNMILSGIITLLFLVQHLQDFRFYTKYDKTEIYPPLLFVNPLGALEGHLWTVTDEVHAVAVRDVYTREYTVFQDGGRAFYYVASVFFFMIHMILGWEKVHGCDALAIPDDQKKGVKLIGWALASCLGCTYMAIPIYLHFSAQVQVDHSLPKTQPHVSHVIAEASHEVASHVVAAASHALTKASHVVTNVKNAHPGGAPHAYVF